MQKNNYYGKFGDSNKKKKKILNLTLIVIIIRRYWMSKQSGRLANALGINIYLIRKTIYHTLKRHGRIVLKSIL